MNNSLNEANKESKGIGCPGWCVSVHFDDLKTTAKGQLLLLMLFPFNKNRKKKSPNKTSMKSSQTNGPFTNDRQSQKVEEEEEAETCHKYLLCLSMSLANHTKEDRINQEKQRNKNKNCVPFNIFLFCFSFFFFCQCFSCKTLSPSCPSWYLRVFFPIVVWTTFAHQTRNDVPQSLSNCLCVSLIVQMETTKKKKREREKSRIPPFFYLLSTMNTTADTKKGGSLRFIWGRNGKQQCPIPTTIFNIRTKHTKTRDKTFDSYTLVSFSDSLLTSHNIPQWDTKRMQPSAD